MLVGESGSHLVLASIVGEVVLDIPDNVVHGIVPSEELISQGDVVLSVTVENIDEGELCRW